MPVNPDFLARVGSKERDARFDAWRAAGAESPDNLPELAKLAASENPSVARAGREAMTTMTHSVGKDEASPKRKEVAAQLTAIGTSDAYTIPIRTHALRLLSLVGGPDSGEPVAKLLKNADLREEAIFCLERIPGKESEGAMMTALSQVPPEFRARVMAALGHRRVALASTLAVRDMRSANKEHAVAAAKAFGRIGKRPEGLFQFPAAAGLTPTQQVEVMDAQLRYADSQGNTPSAISIYKSALAKAEPHWQCAGIIGLAKIGTPEAATLIHPLLKSKDRTVRITAAKAWQRIADMQTARA